MRWFKREYRVDTPIGKVRLSEYKKFRFVEVRSERIEEENQVIIKHYNKFNECYYETLTGFTTILSDTLAIRKPIDWGLLDRHPIINNTLQTGEVEKIFPPYINNW